MIVRALLAALALFATPGLASAQTGGIQVAPVLVSLSPERAMGSVNLRNSRQRPVSFEVEAYAWTQVNGEDQLVRTTDLIVAPGVFEVAANGEQTVRLGVRNANSEGGERAYRILLRELPSEQQHGVALGFTLEMSLPVFMTPRGATANVAERVEGQQVILTNDGDSFAQINLIQGDERLPAPRYLLAGSSAAVDLPAEANGIQLIVAGAGGLHNERTINVGRPDHLASVR